MKRSNHLHKKDAPPIIAKCAGCAKGFTSRFQMKRHLCREGQNYG
jgi:hypothetical protein